MTVDEEHEAYAPHFQCDGCLEIISTCYGMYPHLDGTGHYCTRCATWYSEDEEGEEWKNDR